MGKHRGNRMDGETQREQNGQVNTKVIEWMGKHKGNRMDGETKGMEWMAKQKEWNGRVNTKGIEWMN